MALHQIVDTSLWTCTDQHCLPLSLSVAKNIHEDIQSGAEGWGRQIHSILRHNQLLDLVIMHKNLKNNSSEFKPYEIRDLTIAAVCSVVRKTWIWCSQCLTGAWVRVCTGCSPGARMPTRICYLPCPWAAPAWQAWYENNIFPPSSPQLDRSINLNQSFVLAAAVTDVSYFITVSQSSYVGWRAKLLWLNELLNH